MIAALLSLMSSALRRLISGQANWDICVGGRDLDEDIVGPGTDRACLRRHALGIIGEDLDRGRRVRHPVEQILCEGNIVPDSCLSPHGQIGHETLDVPLPGQLKDPFNTDPIDKNHRRLITNR